MGYVSFFRNCGDDCLGRMIEVVRQWFWYLSRVTVDISVHMLSYSKSA